METSLAAIDRFIEDLIAHKFSDNKPDDAVMTDIKRELTDKLNQYLTLRTIESISQSNPDAIQKLSELIQTNPSAETVSQFIHQYVSEPDVLVAQFFTDFRALYLGTNERPTN